MRALDYYFLFETFSKVVNLLNYKYNFRFFSNDLWRFKSMNYNKSFIKNWTRDSEGVVALAKTLKLGLEAETFFFKVAIFQAYGKSM